jgi:hypothetical protein
MADPGFPGQHTTTTTMTSNTTIQTNTRFDPSYIRTWHGILKCAQIVSLQLRTVITYFLYGRGDAKAYQLNAFTVNQINAA